MPAVLSSLIDAIGNTPLVRLDRLARHLGLEGSLLAKLDYLNPGFSKKDRAARGVIEEVERSGELRPGQTVVELTSGNMGTGLAYVCAIKGYRFVAVMSRGNSEERARMMRAMGAEVVLADQAPGGIPGRVSAADLSMVEAEVERIVAERGAFRADQFRRNGNWKSHYDTTAPEIWSATEGRFDAFVDFVGSGGTFAGVTKFIKERDPRIQCLVVEPVGAAVLGGRAVTDAHHPIQGGGYGYADLAFMADVVPDGFLEVDGEEATAMARELAAREGVFAGFSSGANCAAAVRWLRSAQPGASVVFLACDSGLKYLSTELWA
jgi:cysteine synthase A